MTVGSGRVVAGVVANAATAKFDPMGSVNDPIEDGVRISRIADHLVPGFCVALAGDDQRMVAVTLFDQFHHFTAPVEVAQGIDDVHMALQPQNGSPKRC